MDADKELVRETTLYWEPDSNIHLSPVGYDRLGELLLHAMANNNK